MQFPKHPYRFRPNMNVTNARNCLLMFKTIMHLEKSAGKRTEKNPTIPLLT